MSIGCRACAAGLDHCHGTVIDHLLRPTECTAEGCVDHDGARHPLLLECAQLACGCAAGVG
ncbi:hypothetical protein H7J77_01800 [Mycolicibacillus parakoreensis]|uniref:Uncharacterized protein n=1 Tax=Mycolicibacillus parakoreensis TaxID=1069221 RepID=A0ABY3U653_9MYCO|nr:hypothetical protein [Mycolicibacillus parakoreensis]MCV7314285.1 hypothetical protein [Mycolicibacillus parakoreensis]ULN52992.1 hypothetical protein MIU77_00960 [Mycolicibacillus parakoreensis]HLR98173.1 hypothetical protein [Mycolicibacillus parakoreensis]